ncbi:MAG: hypothetical protein PHO30_02200, partial [Candidatus Omnitrophica bacterium]|nr:hypothetical protein [Candidatus Omnitrophota bacterium]
MAGNNSMIIGLDIGSAKTTLCAGNFDQNGRVEIHNVAMVKSRGVERGVVTDLGELAGCVEEVVRKAESKFKTAESSGCRKKDLKIESVYATINGEHILGNNTKGVLNLSQRPVEITRKDTQRTV